MFVLFILYAFGNSLSRTVGRSHPYSSNERDGVRRENEYADRSFAAECKS